MEVPLGNDPGLMRQDEPSGAAGAGLQAGPEAIALEERSIPRLTPNRFDLAVMLHHLQAEADGPSAFSNDMLVAFVSAATQGSSRALPEALPDSTTLSAVRLDLERRGADAVPPRVVLAADGSVLTGAVEAACAMVLNRPVQLVRTDRAPAVLDFHFFADRGVDRDLLDAVALRFVEWAPDCFVALIWPAAQGSDAEIERILGPLVYRKAVVLNPNGAHNLLSQVYSGEPWLGDPARNYPGIRNKSVHCFHSGGPLRVLVVQKDSLSEVLAAKQAVREVFGLGKHSIHVTDTHAEAVDVARLLLNDRSVHFLNTARPTRFPSTLEMADGFKDYLRRQGLPSERVVVDTGMVLAAYGLRDTQDVDFVSSLEAADEGIFSRHGAGAHAVPVADLLHDPRNHFHFWGLKLVSLEQVARMKRRRKAGRDLDDLSLIGPVLAAKSRHPRLSSVMGHLRFVLAKGRRQAVQATRRLGLHATLKAAQRRIRRRAR